MILEDFIQENKLDRSYDQEDFADLNRSIFSPSNKNENLESLEPSTIAESD